jgi:hypothetical protein
MPIALNDYLKIDTRELIDHKVFNTILDSDSLFFINFMRLRDTKAPELDHSYERLTKFFSEICILLKASPDRYHRFYEEAFKKLEMSEFEEICLGYSMKGTSGSGSGNKLKNIILSTAKDIIDAGVEQPEIFELVGLFEENIGPDRISDMIGRIIEPDLVAYSKRIYEELRRLPKINNDIVFQDDILLNEFNKKRLLLLPQDILHELPIATEWEDIDYVCMINAKVREEINKKIGEQWKELTTQAKKRIFKGIVKDKPEILEDLINDYREDRLSNYNFVKDPLGEAIWYSVAKEFVTKYPIEIKRTIQNKDDLIEIIRKICLHFKQLIENNGLNEILYRDDGRPRRERVSQKLFFSVASSYCDANDADINPEVNSGRGPVDFKFSYGNSMKVLVEVKLTTNNQLIHGYEKQLKEYEKSERTEDAFYLVIDNGGSRKRIEQLFNLHDEYRQKKVKTHELIFVDGLLKPSASNI